ncbi:PP2C family serine/threonine-protein phosphatase, partial [Acetobacter musti]|uniref:hypothetical protein n=1 Tax=Acetobacter musti TaxID=864732 RepID=UPI001A7EC63F
MPRLELNRSRMNQPDGHPILDISRPSIPYIQYQESPVQSGDEFLLMTDGFQRWSPFFGQGDKLSSGLNEDGFYGQGYAETVCGRVQV